MEDRLEKNGIVDCSEAGENLASSTAGAEPVQSALWVGNAHRAYGEYSSSNLCLYRG